MSFQTVDCGFRELRILGNGRDGWPADTVFIGVGREVKVDGNDTVGEIQAAEGCKVTHISFKTGLNM